MFIAGCGTLSNIEGRTLPFVDATKQYTPVTFGGILNDLLWCQSISPWFILDIPFSVIGDICTLPFVQSKKP